MTKSTKTVATDLSQLKAAFQNLRLEVPKLDDTLLKDPNRHDEVVKVVSAGVRNIEESIPGALKYLTKVQAWVNGHEDRIERKIAQHQVADDLKEVKAHIDDCLASDQKFYKAAAARAYLLHALSSEYEELEDARKMLVDLADRELLVKQEGGPVVIGYQRYQIGDVFDLDDEDKADVARTVASFSRVYGQLLKEARHQKSEDMDAEATIAPEQFREGVPGLVKLKVPAESYVDKEGKERWRSGGEILLELKAGPKDTKIVLPKKSSGAIDKEVAVMVKIGVDLFHSHIDRNAPPGYGKDGFSRLLDAIMRTRGLDEEAAEHYIRKMQSLWHLIRRAFKELESKKELAELKEEFEKSADISPQEFFGLGGERKHGTACLELRGNIDVDGKKIYNVFFLATRLEENGEDAIIVTDAPAHVSDFFNSSMNAMFKEEENYRGLPAKLARIFRDIRSNLDLEREIAAK